MVPSPFCVLDSTHLPHSSSISKSCHYWLLNFSSKIQDLQSGLSLLNEATDQPLYAPNESFTELWIQRSLFGRVVCNNLCKNSVHNTHKTVHTNSIASNAPFSMNLSSITCRARRHLIVSKTHLGTLGSNHSHGRTTDISGSHTTDFKVEVAHWFGVLSSVDGIVDFMLMHKRYVSNEKNNEGRFAFVCWRCTTSCRVTWWCWILAGWCEFFGKIQRSKFFSIFCVVHWQPL